MRQNLRNVITRRELCWRLTACYFLGIAIWFTVLATFAVLLDEPARIGTVQAVLVTIPITLLVAMSLSWPILTICLFLIAIFSKSILAHTGRWATYAPVGICLMWIALMIFFEGGTSNAPIATKLYGFAKIAAFTGLPTSAIAAWIFYRWVNRDLAPVRGLLGE